MTKPTPQAIENAARAGEPCPGLKPCPFCGEKKIYFNPPAPEIDFLGSLNCPACLASMPNETNNVEELIGCWNSREPADLGDMVLVSREATVEMVAAFWRQKNTGTQELGSWGTETSDFDAYRAMIEAARTNTEPEK